MKKILKRVAVVLGIYKPLRRLKLKLKKALWPSTAKRFYKSLLIENRLCFDIGANVGSRTAIFLKCGANVVAVEPQDQVREIITRKFGNNKKVQIVDKAISNKNGVEELAICESDSGKSTLSKAWQNEGRFAGSEEWNQHQTVETITFDHLISQFGTPYFCKIDVEGFEYNVLSGLSQPIDLISFEFTKEFLKDAEKCMNKLESISTYEFNFCESENMRFHFDEWVSADTLSDVIREHHSDNLWGDIYARKK